MGDAASEGADAPARPRGADEPAAQGGARGGFQAFRDSVQRRVEAGEITQDSARALFRARMQAAGFTGAPGALGAQAPGGEQGGRQIRNAVVFVVDSAGTPTPKLVQIGLSDWDHTQIVSGLEEGARLAVVGAAQLQAQQQEMMDRIRSRRGGPF